MGHVLWCCEKKGCVVCVCGSTYKDIPFDYYKESIDAAH